MSTQNSKDMQEPIKQLVKSPTNRLRSVQGILERLDGLQNRILDGHKRKLNCEDELKKEMLRDLKNLQLLNPDRYFPDQFGPVVLSPSSVSNYIELVPLNVSRQINYCKAQTQPETQDISPARDQDEYNNTLFKSNNLLEVFSMLILDLLIKYNPEQYEQTFQRFLSLNLDKYESTNSFLVKHKVEKNKFKKSIAQYKKGIDRSSALSQARDSQFLRQYLMTVVKYFVLEKASFDGDDELVVYIEQDLPILPSLRKNLETTLAGAFGLELSSQNLGMDLKLIFKLGEGKLVIVECKKEFIGHITSSSQLSPYRKVK